MNKERIIELGGKEWVKNDMERVYINNEILNTLRVEQGLPGGYCLGERNNKIFFDAKANAVMRSYKGKKPTIEIQY